MTGVLSIKEDGNMLTDRAVVSYYQDPANGEMCVERAAFSEIEDIIVEYSKSPIADTEVWIFVGEDERFLLLLSTEARGDRQFVDRLMELWHSHRRDQAR